MFQKLYKDQPHLGLALSLAKVGIYLSQLDSADKAHEYYEQAVAMMHKLYKGQPYLAVANFLNKLENVLEKMDHFEEVRGFFERALSIYRQLYSDDSHILIQQTLEKINLLNIVSFTQPLVKISGVRSLLLGVDTP